MRDLGDMPRSYWVKVVLASVAGGLVMALFLMAVSAMRGEGDWTPVAAIGATLPAYRPPVPGFDPGAIAAGVIIHLAVSIVWGLMFGGAVAALAPRAIKSWKGATMLGIALAVTLYLIQGLILTPIFAPFVAVFSPGFVWGHLVFGLITAWALKAMASRRELTVTFAPEAEAVHKVTLRR